MFRIILLALVLLGAGIARADDTEARTEEVGLAELLGYLDLRHSDIAFRNDYTDPDSFRLALVADLMEQPWDMVDYVEGLKQAHVRTQPEILAGILFTDLKREHFPARTPPYQADIAEIQGRYNLYYTDVSLNQLLQRAVRYTDVIFPRSVEVMLARLSPGQREFLRGDFTEVLRVSEDQENMTPEELDAEEKKAEAFAERFTTFGTQVDTDPVVAAGVDAVRELLLEVKNIQQLLASGELSAQEIIDATGFLPENTERESYLGLQRGWKVGGPGNDYYSGQYKFIFDFGGDDIYDLSHGTTNQSGTIIIDLGGNDHYRGNTDYTIGAGKLSVGVLLDFGGNDRYDGQSFGIGSGYFGFGLLYDAAGDDRYDGDTHTQGAGSFGLGLLIDEAGRDIYNAALYSQGFGYTQGIGIIFDEDGADSYYAGGKYKDILRYEDHYLSLSQGFGYGLRPILSGGIGAIVDGGGNDSYFADIFAQACAYWWSVGMIYDLGGNDYYNTFQYGQGTATHMGLGLLVEEAGNDVYFGKGLMQGVGHDYSAGILIDRAGDDAYTAYDLSQAAGSANGIGMLIDNSGADRYLIKNSDNTHGYGNPRREFGSIGLFIDLGGDDQHTGFGRNNSYWRTPSKWGGGLDIELVPPDTTGEGTP